MGVNARVIVLDLEMRWMVGTRSGCIVGFSSGEGDGEPSPVGLAGGSFWTAAESSERKLSRVEQMIRVVGAAWCWRM